MILKNILLLVVSTSILSVTTAFAQDQSALPAGVKNLIYAEQHLLSRDLNENRILTPKENHQAEEFKPENSRVFTVKSYWMRQQEVDVFAVSKMAENLKEIFWRKDPNGGKEFLILVHPESESLYKDIVRSDSRGPDFLATSTSSSRTLLMWPENRPDLPFFGKLSLNKEIGGVVRTIPQGEVVRSLGTTEVLYKNLSALPKSFKFFPETFSLIPKSLARGGMIIREIPQAITSGNERFIPLFSLYADRAGKAPLLAEMIALSGIPTEEFIQKRIIDPFVKQWVNLVLINGLSMEPHAQNVLIGLNARGLPNGEFMHRDFGGFNIDFKHFSELEMQRPDHLPVINSLDEDYHQKFHSKSIQQSLETYFEQGFIYNLDQKVPTWIKKGWVADYRTGKSFDRKTFSKMLYRSLAEHLTPYAEGSFQATPAQLAFETDKVIYSLRKNIGKHIKPRCENIF